MPNYQVSYMLQINRNYLLLSVLVSLIFILILTKVLFTRRRPSIGDLLFDFVSQCLGQTRNRVYSRPFAKILLITVSFFAYIFWVVNCATLFSLLATQRTEQFTDYSQLNQSGREIYISAATLDKYSDVTSLLR